MTYQTNFCCFRSHHQTLGTCHTEGTSMDPLFNGNLSLGSSLAMHQVVAPVPCSRKSICAEITLSSMAQENANKTKTTNKIHNFTAYSTSSDLILFIRSMFCYWEVFTATPCLSYHQHWSLWDIISTYVCLWESLSACARKCNKAKIINRIHNCNECATASDLILLFGTMISHC